MLRNYGNVCPDIFFYENIILFGWVSRPAQKSNIGSTNGIRFGRDYLLADQWQT